MQLKQSILALAAMPAASAQRPANASICDYYTTALLKENTAANQYGLLTALVNTVIIGNYSTINTGIAVPGILASGQFNGKDVNLLPYFDGTLKSTNRGGDAGVSVNFLDDGGAAPLKEGKAANSKDSEQYFLVTHLYSFFGSLLGCTQYGMGPFPAYSGDASMYEAHKFMDLDSTEVGYFIQQVGLAAASFGVEEKDIVAVAMQLNNVFNYRCAPPATVIAAQGSQLQSICVAESCPLAKDGVCERYDTEPRKANATGSSTSMAKPTAKPAGSGSGNINTTVGAAASPTGSVAGAVATQASFAAVALGGLAALML